jgi:hypothetical protein
MSNTVIGNNGRSDAVLIPPVTFHRRPDETGRDRHARRSEEALARMSEVEAVACELGQIDLSRPKWVCLVTADAEILWSPSEASLTARVRGKRIPSAHVLDVDGWIEQARSIAATGGLDLRRARPYSCQVVVWREGDAAFARTTRPLGLPGLTFDAARKAWAGTDRLLWWSLLKVHAGATGAAPDRLFPIVPR